MRINLSPPISSLSSVLIATGNNRFNAFNDIDKQSQTET